MIYNDGQEIKIGDLVICTNIPDFSERERAGAYKNFPFSVGKTYIIKNLHVDIPYIVLKEHEEWSVPAMFFDKILKVIESV